MSFDVAEKANRGLPSGDAKRVRRFMIVRGHNVGDEVHALVALLRDPRAGDRATRKADRRVESKWKLAMSPTEWLLMALRSPAVRTIHEDDSKGLYKLQDSLDKDRDMGRLRNLATGEIDWLEYEESGAPTGDALAQVLGRWIFLVILNADAVATTPSLSSRRPYSDYKREKIRGVAIDEAGAMNRPDFYTVWGNCLLPCVMAGDENQLPPAVMSLDQQVPENSGNYVNRHAPEAKLSILGFLKGKGWPVFRLLMQHRMAKGQFNLCKRLFYPDVPFTYRASSEVDKHPAGLAMEAFLRAKFPSLKGSLVGTLTPMFVNVVGSETITDAKTGSKSNQLQVRTALELANEFVRKKGIDPARIGFISAYRANLALINGQKEAYPALQGMPPASTVDSVQGQENDIIFYIMVSI
jgi:hypothetical protein